MLAPILTETIAVNPYLCICRKNKTTGLHTQCPFPKKYGDYCGKHANPNKWRVRCDEPVPNSQKIKTKKLNPPNPVIIDIQAEISNFNISSLKKTLDFYKLPKNGKKIDLQNRLAGYFKKIIPYKLEEDKIIKIQQKYRKILEQREVKLRGPGYLDRSRCNNEEDFYSFEYLADIPNLNFFSYQDVDGFIYGFDIKSFHQLVLLKQNNPYNRQIIPSLAIENMKKLLEIHRDKNLLQEDKCVPLTSKQKFDQQVLKIFQHIENRTSTVNTDWFTELNIEKLKKMYKSLEDIWNYRADLNLTQKIKIVKDKVMFPVTVHKYCKFNNISKLRSIILHEIEKLIFTADEDSEQTLACYYVLTAMCDVSESVRNSFPWLIQL